MIWNFYLRNAKEPIPLFLPQFVELEPRFEQDPELDVVEDAGRLLELLVFLPAILLLGNEY